MVLAHGTVDPIVVVLFDFPMDYGARSQIVSYFTVGNCIFM